MGTYVIKPFSVQAQSGSWFGYNGAASFSTAGADLVTGANNPATNQLPHTGGGLTLVGGLTSGHSVVSTTRDLIRFGFDFSNSIYLDGSGTPTAFSGLTAGFTPTSAQISVRYINNAGNLGNRTIYLQFDPLTQSTNLGPTLYANEDVATTTFAYPGNIPSILTLLANGIGILNDNTNQASSGEFYGLQIIGTYGISSYTWYYNPNTNHFQYSTMNPGAPWVPQTPTISLTSITPNQGPTAFPPAWNSALTQEIVTISGSGIADGAVALLDGIPTLLDSVQNQTSMTGYVGGFTGTLSGPSIVTIDGEDPTHTGLNLLATTSQGNVQVYNPDGTSASLTNAWTYYLAQKTWWQTVSLPFLFFSFLSPNLTFPFPFFFNGIWYPQNTQFVWVNTSAPSKPGWWLSINNDFQGAAFVIAQSTPHNPRSFDEISTFASGSSGMQGGFPGPGCIWNNRLVYAEGGYGTGINQPPIDIYDGAFNHTIALVPTTSTGGIPTAVMSMLSANGTVYFSTLDSGTSSANYSGRVFSLNINTGQMIQLGLATDFATGDVPYSLSFFLGKLWCGTNRGDGTAAHIYWIRPGIDTNWTLDYSLSSSSQGGATSMAVYQGNLYVGCSNASGTFAQVLKRDTSGNWTTSDTASGGTATTNNAYLALAVFGSNLYATYWNNDTPVRSLIRQFNGSTWTTVYTGSGDTNIPLIGLPVDQSNILAIGGGISYNGAVVTSQNGTSWTDNSVFLTGNTGQTTLPVFGVVVR